MGKEKFDNVNHPKHYEGHCSIECIDNMVLIFGTYEVAHFCVINAYKYISRHEQKGKLEDLKKARWYLEKHDSLVDIMEETESERMWVIVEGLRMLVAKEEEKYE